MKTIFDTKFVRNWEEAADYAFPKADIVLAIVLEGDPKCVPLAGFWFPQGFKRNPDGSLPYEYKITLSGTAPEENWKEILSTEAKGVRGGCFLKGERFVKNPAFFYEDFVRPALLEFVDEKRAQYAKLQRV